MKAPPARGPWRTPRPAQRHHPRPRRRSSPRRRAAERPRDHGHGTRPSPTQTAPGGGRSRDHLVGGGRSASHVPYPHLAGRASWPGGHRGDGGERGGAQQPFLSIELSNGFSTATVTAARRPGMAAASSSRRRTSVLSLRAWMVVKILGLSIVQQPTARPRAPRLGWPGGCPTAPPMACPRHAAPPHPAVLAHVSRGASRFSCARPARGGAHVGKAVPCGLGGPREAVSGCLREAAGAELRRGRALRRGNTGPRICVRGVGDAKRRRSYDADPRL